MQMDRLWTPWRMQYIQSHSTHAGCVFCEMVEAKDDAANHVLVRGQHAFVVLNLYPYNNGHLMVAPYAHVASLEDLDDPTLAELMSLTRRALHVLRAAYQPEGFTIGFNIGRVAGAGVADHVHQHIVPRWNGDTSYITTLGQTRVIPELIDQTYAHLREVWQELYPDDMGEIGPP
jgi:ATP adenylyltransferase